MDPDCAICSQPALAQCECEAKGLDLAVRQAEQRMMTSVFSEIRSWVRGHAQDYILSYFGMLTTRRKNQHAETIHRITERAAYYYNARPHPSEVAAVDAELKRGIDDDWKASVQRYPEVLEYFYGLVDLTLPSDSSPGVRDPPLSALNGGAAARERKVRLREPSERERGGEGERRRRRERTVEVERPVAPPPPPMRTVGGGGGGFAGRGDFGSGRRNSGIGIGSHGGGDRGGGGVQYAPMPIPGAGYGYVPAGY